MSDFVTILKKYPNSPMKPNGLIGLKLLWEKSGSSNIFRQKINGSFEFSGKNFKTILPLEDTCCEEVYADIVRTCDNTTIAVARFQSDSLEWDFDLCTAKANNLEIRDLYFGVYKFWEKKINMCSVKKTQAFFYKYRKTIPNPDTNSSTTEINELKNVINTSGCLFSEWVYHCLKNTYLGTPYASIIPTDNRTMSDFLNNPFNVCTGRRNSLAFALVFQGSDFIYPEKTKATGLTNLGFLSEDLAINLKEVLQNLEETFDLLWFIDSNGKFRIEHISYFKNNLSYEPNTRTSIDLTLPKYAKYVENYKYSYKNNTDNYYGVEQLEFSLNQTLHSSDNATKTIGDTDYGTEVFFSDYYFSAIDDFEFGNIKFNEPCSPYDDNGSLKKKTRSNSIFMTSFEPLRLTDQSVDKTKFVLLDCYTTENSTTLGENGVQVPINQIVVSACERNSKQMPNGNFSATAIMRDFLRYNKPFSAGVMSYFQKPENSLDGKFVEKGINRQMYSLLKPKRLKRLSIPYCCGESALNPYYDVKLPNGTFATIEKAEFELSSEMINLDLSIGSNCGFSVIFPELQSGDNYPVRGTVLKREPISIITGTEYICDENGSGCYLSNVFSDGTRTYYADGNGGDYFEDTLN